MTVNKKQLLTGLVTVVPVGMTVMSGLAKLTGSPEVVEGLTKAGVGPYIFGLGLMEIAFAVLFVIPRTMRLGLLLLTAYFAGAMATDLSHGNPVLMPTLLLALVWMAAFVRDRHVFLPPVPPAAV